MYECETWTYIVNKIKREHKVSNLKTERSLFPHGEVDCDDDQVHQDEYYCSQSEVDALHHPPEPPPQVFSVHSFARRPGGIILAV